MIAQPRFDALEDWLAWMETLHPRSIDLSLDRVRAVADAMNIFAGNARVITIAGTNGKGSCVRSLEFLLRRAGKKVGAYTSPHILYYNERIRVDGSSASDQDLCDTFAEIDLARGDISLTYFEFGTLAALALFQAAELDYWLLEVGLGGRLDAVNAIDPDIAILTSVAMDHEAWLGNTRDAICAEKLGIVRPDIPLICVEADPPSNFDALVMASGARALRLGQEIRLDISEEGVSISLSNIKEPIEIAEPTLPLHSVVAALQVMTLEALHLHRDDLDALSELGLDGRFERWHINGRQIILDVAHNPAASKHLARRLENADILSVDALTGIMGDKDLPGTFAPLKAFVDHWTVVKPEGVARAADFDDIRQSLNELGVSEHQITGEKTVSKAIDAWLAQPSLRPLLIFGSFYTVGEAHAWRDKNAPVVKPNKGKVCG